MSVDWLPLAGLFPDQAPVALHELASVLAHVRPAALPTGIEGGETAMLAVGGKVVSFIPKFLVVILAPFNITAIGFPRPGAGGLVVSIYPFCKVIPTVYGPFGLLVKV